MTEQVADGINEPKNSTRLKWWERMAAWLRSNPVMLKELRGRMRGRRAFIVLTAYLLVISFVIGITYFLYLNSLNLSPGFTTTSRQMIGKLIFGVVTGMQLVGLTFIVPALTSGAISTEREHQTYDLLRVTLLPARGIIIGKLYSALTFVLLLLFAALPLQCIAFLFGGVAPEEVALSVLLLVVISISFCAVGLLFSSIFKSTLAATVLSYAVPILTIFGLPLLFAILSGLLGNFLSSIFDSQKMAPAAIQTIFSVLWFFVCLHPIATAVATEVLLLDQHTLWSYSTNITSNVPVTMVSPWLPYTIMTLVISLILIQFSIRFARRRDR
jgi:ABC-type transport system involved in multi-copper enzyme maturation permease subunit